MRVTGKPGRVYEQRTNADLRELRLATPKCVEAMLFEHPFAVAVSAGVTRSVRIVRWVSNTGGRAKPWLSSEQPETPVKPGHCSVECQTAVTDDIMNVVRDQVEAALRQHDAVNAMTRKSLLAISSGWAERFHPTPPSSIYERSGSSSEDEKPSLASLAKFVPSAPPPPPAPSRDPGSALPATRMVRSTSPQPLKPVAKTHSPTSLSMMPPATPGAQSSAPSPLVFGQKTPGHDTPPGLSLGTVGEYDEMHYTPDRPPFPGDARRQELDIPSDVEPLRLLLRAKAASESFDTFYNDIKVYRRTTACITTRSRRL